jgi:putative ABC transport system permease protein
MIRNYFKVAYRNFLKGKLYSVINVTGLAIGITCTILISLYVADELSYDRFHSKADRIYRINEFYDTEDGAGERSSSIPFPTTDALQLDYANIVEHSVRLFNFQAPTLTVAYEPKDKEFNERNFFFVDSTYQKVFDLDLVIGNPETALSNPNSVVISESIARKYFEGEEPMGKLLRFQARADLVVTGVMKDMPLNSHFRADFLGSFSTLREFYGGQYPRSWFWNPCWAYVLLKENVTATELESKLPDFVDKHFPADMKNDVIMRLQPLTSIHLQSHLEFEISANGSESNIYLFSGVAIFVLIIACINFMNLSTARSLNRAKEVGMRKTIGCTKRQLVFQFMLESVLLTLLAVVFSVCLAYLSLPWFNNFSGKQLILDLTQPSLIAGMVLAGIGVGVASGIYPAAILTSFNPITALKAKHNNNTGFTFRKVLVVAQFTISIVLIIGTGVAIAQLNFLQSDDVGFKKDNIIMVPVMRSPLARQYQAFVDEAYRIKDVESVTALEEVLGAKYQAANYQFEGMEKESLFPRLNVRHDFLKTFNIPLISGRDYSREVLTDDSLALVVNETLVKGLGWTADKAIGKTFTFGAFRGQIVGVARDFNFSSKHAPIGPLVMHLNTNPGGFNLFLKYMAVRINPANTQQAIQDIEGLWNKMIPSRPFEYFFLDNELNNLYQAEANLGRVAGTFSVLAILVACLGLFGLASYSAEQRKKEIGIRKVLGSSINQLLVLVLSDFAWLLLAAILIACPLAYLAMNYWLSTFAYRIDMPILIFLIASVVTILVALLTVGYKSISVARSNPVDSLREE